MFPSQVLSLWDKLWDKLTLRRRAALRSHCPLRVEALEVRYARSGLSMDISEDFEDGRCDDQFAYCSYFPNERIVQGVSHGSGTRAYEIFYDQDESMGQLSQYPIDFQSMRVSYWQQYPDGTTFPAAHANSGAIKQSRIFHSEGGGLGFNLQINWSEDTHDYYYTVDQFLLADGSPADRAFFHFQLPANEWFKTSYEVRLNDPGQANGSVCLWHDDQLILDLPKIIMVGADGERPDGVWVGGNSNYTNVDRGKPWTPFRRWIDDVVIDIDPTSSVLPSLAISDVTVSEGDPATGAKVATFTVTATTNAATFSPVTVNYATTNDSAQAGPDYTSVTGQLCFTSAMRTKTITVPIRPDLLREQDEMFFVRLSNAVGATISDGEGKGTIIDDDTPQLSINDVSVFEGNSGTKPLTFTVTLSKAVTQMVSFRATTYSGSATAGQDFQSRSQVITIPGGSPSAVFSVSVNGDTRLETDEKFTVMISEVVGAVVGKSTGLGTIVNDDLPLPAAADKMGVVRNGHDWFLDTAGDGYLAERTIGFGLPGDRSFTADMNNDGREELVVARKNSARGGIDWYIDFNGDGNLGERIVQFGLLGDIPLIGDFDANGRDDLAAGRWNAARGGYD